MVNQSPEQPEYQYDWQKTTHDAFDFGRAFSRAFEALKKDWKRMFLLTFAFLGFPVFLANIWPMFLDVSAFYETGDVSEIYDIFGGSLGIVIGLLVVGVFLVVIASLWLQPALIQMTYATMKNERLEIGAALRQSVRFILPYLGMTVLYGLAVMLGFILLIIPAIFIGLGWLLAYQIMILEGERVTDSLGRAWTLSKGYKRWLLLFAIVFGVIGAIMGVVISIPLYFLGDPALAMLEGASTGYWIVNGISSSLAQVIGTMLAVAWTTSAYVEIRQVREGLDLNSQADIFS